MEPHNPAFPLVSADPAYVIWPGMTLRTYIATQAMAALLADTAVSGEINEAARDAVRAADALIAELAK